MDNPSPLKKTKKKVTRKVIKKTTARKDPVKKRTGRSIDARTVKAPSSMPKGSPLGTEFHGVTLSTGDVNRSKRHGVLSMLDLLSIKVQPGFNPRAQLGDVKDLATSIESEGLLQALVVRPGKEVGTFDVICGGRRHKAMVSVKYAHPVPCLIRTDLVGDDDRALACALAENSEDCRTNLNMVEIGRAVQRLEKEKWSVTKIACETGLTTQRVRRAKALMETPEKVRRNIVEGKWSVQAGLEYAKLDPATRAKIKTRLDNEMTSDDIRRVRRIAEREAQATSTAKGGKVDPKVNGGRPRGERPGMVTWRGSREKQQMLQRLCSIVHRAEPEEIGGPENMEFRGAIACALWDRGDRDSPASPYLNPDRDAPDYEAETKDTAAFQATIKAEAEKYDPENDPEE